MIVSQFQETRRFMGRLDAGQDLLAGIRTICRENGIGSAWFMGSAVLRNPSVAALAPDGSGLADPVVVEGTCLLASIGGNVSLENEAISIRLYATCQPQSGDAPAVSGILYGGEVCLCEFLIVTMDDLALVRDGSDPSGFAPWMQVQAGAEMRIRAAAARTTEGPAPRPPAPPPTYTSPDEDESTELNILDMREGDYVDHPRFGECRIVHAPQDEKISIRLPTGKHVDLSLGVMRVLPPRQKGGRKVFQVEVRRKA